MSKPKKDFDCVEMKNSIQATLYERRKGSSRRQVRQEIRRELETSQTPLARWWRSIRRRRADKVET